MKSGQCWMSESEPELGLGFVVEVDHQTVTVRFPGAEQDRRYGRKSAPLKRVKWQLGDHLEPKTGKPFTVEQVEVREDLYWYSGEGRTISESEVSLKTKLFGPIGRLLSGQWDAPLAFELRRQTLHYWSTLLNSPVRGLLGPRVELIPHQVYVVTEVAARALPRVLLADEVGLGKTIEAGWIAHYLLTTGRMNRVLVLAPKAMVNQWFVEMRRRFNLTFRVPESEAEGTVEQIDVHNQLILSIESLAHDSVAQSLLATEWDLIIVDEAHRIGWSVDQPSPEYVLLKLLSQGSRGLLLLTATPEQLGIEGHFGRLHLLDPQRFASFEDYLKEHARYERVAEKVQNLDDDVQKRDLIDRHGTGRVYFRNARRVVEAESYRFPERVLKAQKLKSSDEKLVWLKNLLDQNKADKFLLICSTRAQVEEIDSRLKPLIRINTAMFHEGQSLVVRDRSAAYFADPEGARLMLSSEIGSEGRNFQFARHQVLWDLPADPDILEQRIGRLDRIGQRTEFLIHVPVIENSEQELLFRWYDEVFGIFNAPATGASDIHFKYWPVEAKSFASTLKKAKADYKSRRESLEQGRDRLIEFNSFDSETALQRVRALDAAMRAHELRDYMESIFSWVGVNEEDLDSDSVFVEPGDAMFIPSFPGLPDEGVKITYERRKALEREDLSLLSWDHPMVREIMEMILGQEFGNVSIARWKEALKPPLRKPPLVECYMILQSSADAQWVGDEFFPPYPIRVVLDARTAKNVTTEWSSEKLSSELSRIKTRPEDWDRSELRNVVKSLCDKALELSKKEQAHVKKQAIQKLKSKIESEIERLSLLAKKNGLVSPKEIAWWLTREEELEKAFTAADLRLDSVRVIF